MKKVLGASRNQCPGCGLYFNSNKAFDKHRTGKHGVDRRCMTEQEMLNKGMCLNDAGFWVSKLYEVVHDYGTKTESGNADSTGDGS